MPYKHVLAAVDLSSESAQVLEKARAPAGSHGAKLSLITIVKPFTHAYGGLDMAPMADGSFEEEASKQATQQLEDNGKIYGVDRADVHEFYGKRCAARCWLRCAGRSGESVRLTRVYGI